MGSLRAVTDIIDNLEFDSKHDDSWLSGTKRPHIQRVVREGVRELYKNHVHDIRALRMTIKEGNWVSLPADYLNAVRISEFTDCGKLRPIKVDASIMVGNVYLTDHLDRILLDDKGIPLLGTGDADIDRNCTIYDFDYSSCPYYAHSAYYSGRYNSYFAYQQYYNLNHSFSREVSYRVDEFNKKIQFSGRDVGEILLEYKFDIMNSVGVVDDLTINEYFAVALERYAYHRLVASKRSVPISEKERARKDYKEALILAKLGKNSFSINQLASNTNLS